jgi:hypothetical protein
MSDVLTAFATSTVVTAGAALVLREVLPRFLDKRFKQQEMEFEAKLRSSSQEEDAWRVYSFDARRRLYETVGPLRFQLLLASRELANRVAAYPLRPYNMSAGGYYVTSFTYRVIRPLAFAELIERQIAYADFSVDPQVVDLLRFKAAARAMLCDAEVIFDDPDADWMRQREHFFSGNFGGLARSGLANEPDGTVRVLREEEFGKVIDEREMSALAHQMLASLDLAGTPRLWARLAGYGYVANWLLDRLGPQIGISPLAYPVGEMMQAVRSPHLRGHAEQFPARLDDIIASAL